MVLVLLTLCACGQQDDPVGGADAPDQDETMNAPDPAADGDLPAESGWDEPSEDAVDGSPEESQGSTGLTDYVYSTVEDEALQMRYKYPSHWTHTAVERSVVCEEPTEPDATPIRMAIARKDAGNIVVTEEVGMDKLTAFKNSLKASCTDFRWKRGKRFKFSGNVGFQFLYTGTFGGVPMKGYAALTYSPKKKAFYLFHFSAPTDRYAAFDKVRKTILASIKV